MGYRLGLDLGTNSLGWCVLDLDESGRPTGIRDLGVRIFSDGRNPKDGTSLAVMRRLPRQQRRRRDRYLRRRARLMDALVRHGLMPADPAARKRLEKEKDPYELRARGLDHPLDLHELGRAIFHLNQRRGFKSNRRIDRMDDKESGKIRSAIASLRDQMGDNRTVGEYLYQRRLAGLPVRIRLQGEGAKSRYDFYVEREMIADEFDQLWEAQKVFHGDVLCDEARDEIRDILLFQRDLRAVDPGRCTFEPDEPRAPTALPIVQRFRIYQELNHLRIIEPGLRERSLARTERDQLARELLARGKLTFVRMRNILDLPADSRFSHEDQKRKDFKGDLTAAVMRRKTNFGPLWDRLDAEEQMEIVERVLSEKSEQALVEFLKHRWNLTDEQANSVSMVRLPEGYSRLGRTALEKVLKHLEEDVITYDEAVVRAGYDHHSFFYAGEIYDALPYYARVLERHVLPGSGDPSEQNEEVRYGRIANPSVHIGLNQVRKVINELIRRHGHPEQIVVELARDLKNSKRQKDEIQRRQKALQDKNQEYAQRLEEQGLPDNAENRLRLRLWEELNPENPLERRCVYTGEQISIRRLFSPEIEIEHILPFSRSLDDSPANKTLCTRRANRDKGNRTPFEAFGHSPAGYHWNEIEERAACLPPNKRWRFMADAMERLARDGDFLDRHLNETRYLARLTKEYLSAICPPNAIWVTPGRLTAMLRAKWGLNNLLSKDGWKNRMDHRHHAIDAAVIGVIDRSLLQRVARHAGLMEEKGVSRVLEGIPLPWDGYREELNVKIHGCHVSHKPDHGIQAALHNDTAYGILDGPDAKGRYKVWHRVPLKDFKHRKALRGIANEKLREAVLDYTDGFDGKEFRRRLEGFAEKHGIRRVRVVEHLSVIPIRDRNGKIYKAYKGDSNYCYEIVREDNGRWSGEIISSFQANQRDYKEFQKDRKRYFKVAFSGKPLVMRLCKNDTVAIGAGDDRRLLRVVKFSEGEIVFADLHEGGNLKSRNADKNDLFSYMRKSPSALKTLKARRVFVDILGRVKDPGFRECLEESLKSTPMDAT